MAYIYKKKTHLPFREAVVVGAVLPTAQLSVVDNRAAVKVIASVVEERLKKAVDGV